MIEFILNNTWVKTDSAEGGTLLDFVRYESGLVGTKIGCREGDCGACTLLIGEIDSNEKMSYKSVTSCISPLGNAHGRHVVTIEGINRDKGLQPYQKAMVDESASQCGFCTVGFVMSFAGECLSENKVSTQSLISAVDGNICRCTGYKSIERAAKNIAEGLEQKERENTLLWLIDNEYIPAYFARIPERLRAINKPEFISGEITVGGGTDLLVQGHDSIYESDVQLISNNQNHIGIIRDAGKCIIAGATNTTELMNSPIMQDMVPNFYNYLKLVSSTPIRNMGTVAGNLVNASPIGDLTALFLAFNATIHLLDSKNIIREVALNKFYLGYKKMDLKKDEIVSHLSFDMLKDNSYFNFDKVSKRKFLDIATVNTAINIEVTEGVILDIHVSAGGVGPTPIYLTNTCIFLKNRELNAESILNSLPIILEDIAPISDVRGSKEYKSFLLRQLFFGHFIELFPDIFSINQLLN